MFFKNELFEVKDAFSTGDLTGFTRLICKENRGNITQEEFTNLKFAVSLFDYRREFHFARLHQKSPQTLRWGALFFNRMLSEFEQRVCLFCGNNIDWYCLLVYK